MPFPLLGQVNLLALVLGLSVVAIIYGAAVSTVQRDLKKLVAYSSVAHMGFVTLGAFVLNAQGMAGAVLQMVNHGLVTGALFLCVGIQYDRTHRRLIAGSLLLFPVARMGAIYLATALALGAVFVAKAARLWRRTTPALAWGLFRYSINYLGLLFAAVMVDRLIHISA